MSVEWLNLKQWIGVCAGYLNPAFPADAAEALLRLKAPLANTFPPEAFTPVSAQRVAEARRYGPVPDLAAVSEVLRTYLRDTRPIYTALPAPREPEYARPGPEEIARIDALLARHKAERPVADNWRGKPAELRDVTLRGRTLAAARTQGTIHMPERETTP